jgi:phosphate/phosphite/phosphonate ABC transporter binding protein
MRRWLLLVLAIGCAAPTPEGDTPAHARPHRPTTQVSMPPEVRRVRLGLTPYLRPQDLLRDTEPFRAWMQDRLGVPVSMTVAANYDGLGQMLARGEIDLAAFSPYGYLRAQQGGIGLRPLVTVIADGSARSAGYVVVRDDSPVRTVEELKGARVAFVDPASTSGWLMSSALLLKKGVHPSKDLGGAAFLGSHDAVLDAVLAGTFDAGAVYQGALAMWGSRNTASVHRFRIVGKTSRMPRDVYCVRKDAPEGLADALLALLADFSTLHPDGRTVLDPMSVNGFVRVDDSAFDELREVDQLVREQVQTLPAAEPATRTAPSDALPPPPTVATPAPQ